MPLEHLVSFVQGRHWALTQVAFAPLEERRSLYQSEKPHLDSVRSLLEKLDFKSGLTVQDRGSWMKFVKTLESSTNHTREGENVKAVWSNILELDSMREDVIDNVKGLTKPGLTKGRQKELAAEGRKVSSKLAERLGLFESQKKQIMQMLDEIESVKQYK